jgi:hypothetical protein
MEAIIQPTQIFSNSNSGLDFSNSDHLKKMLSHLTVPIPNDEPQRLKVLQESKLIGNAINFEYQANLISRLLKVRHDSDG